MTFSFGVPTIGAIQRTNVLLVGVSAGVLALVGLGATALGCLLGGAVVIVNLYLLALLGSFLLAAASGSGGSRSRLGMLALPLKLLIYAGIIYLVLTRARVDAMGLGLGILTQMIAIVIETGRASLRSAPV